MEKNSNQKTDSAPEVLNNDPIKEAFIASILHQLQQYQSIQDPELDKFIKLSIDTLILNTKRLNAIESEMKIQSVSQIKILDQLKRLEEASIPKEWVNESVAASMLSICKRKLYSMKVEGIIGHSKVNGKSFFKIIDINTLISANYMKSFK